MSYSKWLSVILKGEKMELTQEFFIALGNNYSDANIEKALRHVDYLISEEEAYFELGTAAVKEELNAQIGRAHV